MSLAPNGYSDGTLKIMRQSDTDSLKNYVRILSGAIVLSGFFTIGGMKGIAQSVQKDEPIEAVVSGAFSVGAAYFVLAFRKRYLQIQEILTLKDIESREL